jgi:hypothetical protein
LHSQKHVDLTPQSVWVTFGQKFSKMQYKQIFLWFRFLRQKTKTHPWTILAIASCKWLWVDDIEKKRQTLCLLFALCKINWISVYEAIDDLIRYPM